LSTASSGGYGAVTGHWDEMAGPEGEVRRHWRELMTALDSLGDEEFMRRWDEGRRLIQEHGVTYNVYGDPLGTDRPWQLDPIPLLIAEDEWASIEQAVVQRATLLNRILCDIYGGGGRLLEQRRLPPELVFANPGFLRPCRGLAIPEDVYLHVYAADLARSPDGRWWVLADRTQAPSGAGYALENRIVLSRTLPEAFRSFHVQRLAGYFRAYRETLLRLAPKASEAPRVVLLTPGPYNETYFEQAYLARYLGFILAEGADLTVRDEHVYLKTLSGLLRVDVILRRQDDSFCDPLELFGESALGIAGLVQAARAGNVTVANALGSGLLESAATMAFLPALCRELLGEELRMPSVATWWCGQERERAYVREHLDHLVIKPTFAGPGETREVVFGGELSRQQRESLQRAIDAAPHRYVAQERVALSTAPTAVEGGTAPRHVVLRVYAVAHEGGWTLMPGGLTRVSAAADSLVVSSQRGGGSKDTWVLSAQPVPYESLLANGGPAAGVSRTSFVLTSRVADDLLWLGRMSERVEAGARVFRCALRRLAEEPIRDLGAPPVDAVRLLASLGWLAASGELSRGREEDQILEALFDRAELASLGSNVVRLQQLAWRLRDRISNDAWRVLSALEKELRLPTQHPALRVSRAIDLLDHTLTQLAAFTGLVMESMTRDLGWQFLDIGRRVERGVQVVDLLRHGLVEQTRRSWRRLESLLEIADSAMTYRSRYQTSVHPALVIDLLLLDEANPRGIAFQLVTLRQRFAGFPKAPIEDVDHLIEALRATPLDQLAEISQAEKRRPRLAALLDALSRDLPALAEALGHAYLSHAVPRREPVGIRKPA
jgi:uncharacterized circularly permuted ATP-grasp superfamily protein/uncharacterized alpha-E superfamily protein